MDDDEEEYEYGSDEYNYSDEEGGGEGGDELIEIENAFYEGEDIRGDAPEKAVEMFEKVVSLEKGRGSEVKWRFKALEHLVVLNVGLNRAETALENYREMLEVAPEVTRNECGDGVNAVLDAISAPNSLDGELLAKFYEMTFAALKASSNERLWFNSNLKVGKLYLQKKEFTKVASIVDQLREACRLKDGSDDASKGTALLEAYALEIQLAAAVGDTDRMQEVYPKTLDLTAAVADPRILGVVREEGGKMYMADGEWFKAYNEFYSGFRAYQEAGNSRAKDCLKYVVLANMLAASDINPFDGREAKAYQEEPEITAMRQLRLAYDGNDLRHFQSTLNDPKSNLKSDPFIMSYLAPLTRKMQEQVLLNMVKPYHRLTLQFIADELKLSMDHVHSILVDLILDNRIDAKIDDINKHLLLGGSAQRRDPVAEARAAAIDKWAAALDHLCISATARVM